MTIGQLIDAKNAILKLLSYGYLTPKQNYYLATMQPKLFDAINAYYLAERKILERYGESEDGQYFEFTDASARAQCLSELSQLKESDAGVDLLCDKIRLNVDSIDKIDEGLPPSSQLGFCANDWLAIKEIVNVVEQEE